VELGSGAAVLTEGRIVVVAAQKAFIVFSGNIRGILGEHLGKHLRETFREQLGSNSGEIER
jgi:hypothetical protein